MKRIVLAPLERFEGTRLILLKELPIRHIGSQVKRMVRCLCDCGEVIETKLECIRRGYTSSCGCLNKDTLRAYRHSVSEGRDDHWLYTRWNGMLHRCYNDKHKDYKSYGAKGITVCFAWRLDFWDYVLWIENVERMCKHYSFEVHRINSAIGYNPDNCVCVDSVNHRLIHSSIMKGWPTENT